MDQQPKREWDQFDREAERESKHAPGHYGKRQATRKGLRGDSDAQWEAAWQE